MIRYLLIAVVLGVMGLSGALTLSLRSNAALKVENRDLRHSVDAFEEADKRQKEAAAVHRAHLARQRDAMAAQAERQRNLQNLEGGDAPLSDYLRDASKQLWP